jgi:hypothetical protein
MQARTATSVRAYRIYTGALRDRIGDMLLSDDAHHVVRTRNARSPYNEGHHYSAPPHTLDHIDDNITVAYDRETPGRNFA